MKYTILEELMPQVREKVNKFQHKFTKYGEGQMIFTCGAPYRREAKTTDGHTYFQNVVDVEVEGTYQLQGYTFVASLEYFPEVGKNIIKKIPNSEEIPKMYITRTACDHCQSNRVRKYTILLKKEDTGEYVQVGRQCVKDYLGVDVSRYISYLAFFETLEQYLEETATSQGNSRVNVQFTIHDVLAQAIARQKEKGYISKAMVTKWYEENDYEDIGCPFNTTASDVFRIMNQIGPDDDRIPFYPITEEIEQEVAVIEQFIAGLDEESDYVSNLKTLMEVGYTDNSNMGLVVSMVGYYIRKTTEKKQQEERIRSEFVGNVGDKITITATPECIFSAPSDFGYFYIYKFTVGTNEFIWKTSKELEAEELTLKATIKQHTVHNNVKQTEITRARVA